jgi:SAM-dependent methyltransferase
VADDGQVLDMRAYRSLKRTMLADLAGLVLEIGAGGGANFQYFPAGARWVGLEPGRLRGRRLARMAIRRGLPPAVLGAVAEHIPLADGSVDAVVSSVVLCSVDDQDRALAEVRRVLRPGGAFVFFEHVGAPVGTLPRRVQQFLAPVSRRIDSGCDPSRETWVAIGRAGFATLDLRWFVRRPRWHLYSPMIAGRATA